MQDFLSFQWISLYVFLALLLVSVVLTRKRLELQKIIFPLLYAGLYKTNFGLKFMNWVSKKYRGWIIFLGYCGIGVGFIGMIVIVIGVIQSVVLLFTQPQLQAGVSLVLPQTQVPGLGFLSFWYWIIALFVLILIHEFSHGIVARAHGLKVKSSGLGFFAVGIPLIPLAFVEPDEKEVEKAGEHVQWSIFAAGPFSNIITAVLILLLFMVAFNPLQLAMTHEDGVTYSLINESYPASNLPEGFIIREVNGRNTTNAQALLAELSTFRPNENVTFGNGTATYTLTLAENEGRAFLGIIGPTTIRKLNENVNVFWYNVYDWFRGLFYWIGWLSFLIGLANLLPLGPVDGGRMLKTLLELTHKNKEKANKRWIRISLFVLVLILFGLFYPLIKGWI